MNAGHLRRSQRPQRRTLAGVMIACALGTVGITACSSSDSLDTINDVRDAAISDGYETQAEILDDLIVTPEELQSSLDDLYGCFADNGIRYTDEGVNPLDGWQPVFTWRGSGQQGDRAQSSYEYCRSHYYEYVRLGYGFTHDDRIQPDVLERIRSCLSDAGVTVDAAATNLKQLLPEGANDPHRSAVLACVDRATKGQATTPTL